MEEKDFRPKDTGEFIALVKDVAVTAAKQVMADHYSFNSDEHSVLMLMIKEREEELERRHTKRERWEEIRRQVIGWVIITALSMVGAFGYWLWQIVVDALHYQRS